MDKLLKTVGIPPKWNHRTRSFLLYILPLALIDLTIGLVQGDVALGAKLLPAIAMWGLTGKIQAVPATWALLLLMTLTVEDTHFSAMQTSIWITTATGLAIGGARLYRTGANDRTREGRPSWWEEKFGQKPFHCAKCQKDVYPVRPPFPIGWAGLVIATMAVIFAVSDWIFNLPAIIFSIARLTAAGQCPECRERVQGKTTPFDTEGKLLLSLTVLLIAGGIAFNIVNKELEPTPVCTAAIEAVQEKGGPDLFEANDLEIDTWLETDPRAWDLYDEVHEACWSDSD